MYQRKWINKIIYDNHQPINGSSPIYLASNNTNSMPKFSFWNTMIDWFNEKNVNHWNIFIYLWTKYPNNINYDNETRLPKKTLIWPISGHYSCCAVLVVELQHLFSSKTKLPLFVFYFLLWSFVPPRTRNIVNKDQAEDYSHGRSRNILNNIKVYWGGSYTLGSNLEPLPGQVGPFSESSSINF